MATVAMVHHSGTGKTKSLALAIAAGARSVAGTKVLELAITGAQIHEGRFQDDALLAQLDGADAIVFGAPTYMGMVSGQFKTFADATGGRWYQRSWAGKIAGGFTTSGSFSGDKQGSLLYLATLAAQLGMLWVGQNELNGLMAGQPMETAVNRLGSHLGPMGQAAPVPEAALTAGDLKTGELYGARIAAVAAKLHS
jgi:NAD(P)H dehydrogenase (quinone)